MQSYKILLATAAAMLVPVIAITYWCWTAVKAPAFNLESKVDATRKESIDGHDHDLQTRIRCTGECCYPAQARRCMYENLYFHNGTFWVFSIGQYRLLEEGLQVSKYSREWESPFVPQERMFDTETSLLLFVNQNNLEEKQGTTLLVWSGTPFNFGHAVFDELFPAFLRLIQLGVQNMVNETFHLVEMNTGVAVEWRDSFPTKIKEKFLGGSSDNVLDLPKDRLIRYAQVAVGSGDAGMMWRNEFWESSFYSMEAGPSVMNTPIHAFRERMYLRHDTPPPLPRTHSTQNRANVLRVILIHNKRSWTDLQAAADAIRRAKSGYYTFHVEVIDWPQVSNGFAGHLRVLQQTDIYVSSVGTALTAAPFMSDAGVVVNVGWEDGFWDEYALAAIPYLRVVYPETCSTWRSPSELVKLVQKAAELIASNFSTPVERGASLSDIGRAMAHVLQSSPRLVLKLNLVGEGMGCWAYAWAAFDLACGSYSQCVGANKDEEAAIEEARAKFNVTRYCQ